MWAHREQFKEFSTSPYTFVIRKQINPSLQIKKKIGREVTEFIGSKNTSAQVALPTNYYALKVQ